MRKWWLLLLLIPSIAYTKTDDPVFTISPSYNNIRYFVNEYTRQYDGLWPSTVTIHQSNTYNSYSTSNSITNTYNVTYTTAYVSNSGTWWDLAPSGWLQMNDNSVSDSEWTLDAITGYLEMK